MVLRGNSFSSCSFFSALHLPGSPLLHSHLKIERFSPEQPWGSTNCIHLPRRAKPESNVMEGLNLQGWTWRSTPPDSQDIERSELSSDFLVDCWSPSSHKEACYVWVTMQSKKVLNVEKNASALVNSDTLCFVLQVCFFKLKKNKELILKQTHQQFQFTRELAL